MLDTTLGDAVEREDHIQRREAQPVLPAAHGSVCQPGGSSAHVELTMLLPAADTPAFLPELCQV